ncbi:MAG: phosphopantetheine-binding protein [Bacteroidota bacterium]
MKENEIISKLREIVSPYVEDKSLLEGVKPETNLLSDLQINSADLVDIVLDTEEAFDIEIEDEAADQMLTVEDVVRIIAERVKQ